MPLRVLVVDDDLPGLDLAQCVLARLGMQVAFAKDGRECIAAFRLQRFDVVLMDRLMPGMSGPEAVTEIRRIEAEKGWPRTAIIAVTACVYRSQIDEFARADADDVLLKPYRVADLEAMLEKWRPCR